MSFFKDEPEIADAPLEPPQPVVPPGGASQLVRSLARTYNRLGGLLTALSSDVDVSVEATLAVWQVESGGLPHVENRPVLRFENHKFFEHWGKNNTASFDSHFQFGGRKGIAGKKWENHRFRRDASQPWRTFHGDQAKEYDVFEFASGLGGLEPACLASSFGGPQILGSNYEVLGYDSATALFRAFQESERWHVCGFFDFCRSNNLIDEIQQQRWVKFAEGYNGKGQAEAYGAKIQEAFEAALELDLDRLADAGEALASDAAAAAVPAVEADGMTEDVAEFVAFIAGLGLKNFKPYELLTMGHQHHDPNSPAHGLNRRPPRELWGNIVPTIRILDTLRDLVGAPIVITSAYRSPEYNQRIAGATNSQHVRFRALDFMVKSLSGPAEWAAMLRQMRMAGAFSGGIGTYSTFVHVDTRGTNADW